MKTITLCCVLLMGLLIFQSCSSDDELEAGSDIIIGKWRAIERYESNVPVTLPVCLPYLYTEYKANRSINGDKIMTPDFPEECGIITFDLGWNWKNLGNNQYRIRYLEEQGQVFTCYKEGDNLVEENPDGITKTIYEPY